MTTDLDRLHRVVLHSVLRFAPCWDEERLRGYDHYVYDFVTSRMREWFFEHWQDIWLAEKQYDNHGEWCEQCGTHHYAPDYSCKKGLD